MHFPSIFHDSFQVSNPLSFYFLCWLGFSGRGDLYLLLYGWSNVQVVLLQNGPSLRLWWCHSPLPLGLPVWEEMAGQLLSGSSTPSSSLSLRMLNLWAKYYKNEAHLHHWAVMQCCFVQHFGTKQQAGFVPKWNQEVAISQSGYSSCLNNWIVANWQR